MLLIHSMFIVSLILLDVELQFVKIHVDVNEDAVDGIFADISTWEKLMWRWCFNCFVARKRKR